MAEKIKKINNKEVEVRETTETKTVYNIEQLKEQRKVYKERLEMIEKILKAIGEL